MSVACSGSGSCIVGREPTWWCRPPPARRWCRCRPTPAVCRGRRRRPWRPSRARVVVATAAGCGRDGQKQRCEHSRRADVNTSHRSVPLSLSFTRRENAPAAPTAGRWIESKVLDPRSPKRLGADSPRRRAQTPRPRPGCRSPRRSRTARRRRWPGASRLMLTPACSRATDSRVPGRSWPQPCGRLTTPRRISSLTSTTALDRRRLRRDPGRRPVGQTALAPRRRGWTISVQRGLPFTSTVHVVHPRVVGAHVAAADQHQPSAATRPCGRRSRGRSPRMSSCASSTSPDGGARALRRAAAPSGRSRRRGVVA